MNKHKSNKIKENSNTVRHLIMGQITTTQNLVAIKEVRHAGQWSIVQRRTLRRLGLEALISDCPKYMSVSVNFIWYYRADSKFAPSQWETSLQSNPVSRWRGANLESALYQIVSWAGSQHQSDNISTVYNLIHPSRAMLHEWLWYFWKAQKVTIPMLEMLAIFGIVRKCLSNI